MFSKYLVLLFFKMRYEIIIPIVTSRHLKFPYENIISPLLTHSQIWHVSTDLHPRNITMLGSNTSSDVSTSLSQCLKFITVSFTHMTWSDNLPVMRIQTLNLWKYVTTTTLIARFIGPRWGPPGADRTQAGPMWATWTLLSGKQKTIYTTSQMKLLCF